MMSVASVAAEKKETGATCKPPVTLPIVSLTHQTSQSKPDEPSSQETLAVVRARLRSAKSDIIFLQNEHRITLRGLHAEIARLQKQVRELQFALIMQGITIVDEESYQKKIAALEDELDKWCCHCRYLTSQLEQANSGLVSLNQRLQLQDWQHQTEIAEKDSMIANLQRELEWKCSALAELGASSRKKTILTRMPFSLSNPPAASGASSNQQVSTESKRIPSKGSATPPLSRSTSSSLGDDSRLPEIHHGDRRRVKKGPRQLIHGGGGSSDGSLGELSDEHPSGSRSHPSLGAQGRTLSAKCLPTIDNPQKSTNSRPFSGVRLPPLVDGSRHSLFPTRSLVRQQLRVHCEAGVDVDDGLSIDRMSSPELRPKKVTNGKTVEVMNK